MHLGRDVLSNVFLCDRGRLDFVGVWSSGHQWKLESEGSKTLTGRKYLLLSRSAPVYSRPCRCITLLSLPVPMLRLNNPLLTHSTPYLLQSEVHILCKLLGHDGCCAQGF